MKLLVVMIPKQKKRSSLCQKRNDLKISVFNINFQQDTVLSYSLQNPMFSLIKFSLSSSSLNPFCLQKTARTSGKLKEKLEHENFSFFEHRNFDKNEMLKVGTLNKICVAAGYSGLLLVSNLVASS